MKQYIKPSSVKTKEDFKYGLKRGLPIAIGYFPVSFTFGLMAVKGGLPIWLTVFISLSNLTSAGQFAGTNLILANASLFEISLTTFIINLRYMLMSLSLSQKIDTHIPLMKRLIFSFGITDETFSIASLETGKLSASYMFGLILLPMIGWTSGTLCGAWICQALPVTLSNAMGIALYGMFLAILIPAVKESKAIFIILIFAVLIHTALTYITLFSFISSGFRIIIATLISATVGAILFPIKE